MKNVLFLFKRTATPPFQEKKMATFEDRHNLHEDLTEFVRSRVATMKNNSSAAIFQFEKCELSGNWFICPVSGCMNTDFDDCNRQLSKAYGDGARLKSEMRADGGGFIVRLLVNLENWKKSGRSKSGAPNDSPSFQTLVTLFLTDIVLVGALCWKVGILA